MVDHAHALGRTIPSADFARPAAAAPPAPSLPPDDAPRITRTSVDGRDARRFAIGALLGSGATSQVYAVEDRDLERTVAIKLLSSDQGPPAAAEVERFIQEARITASLGHPNVLPVHDIDVDEQGRVFFTMTRVDGRSLGVLIEQSTMDARVGALADANALVSVGIGVCQALAFAHRRGIVHQDIKPDNIMLGEFGEVLVVDWGSARRGAIDDSHLYGTPLYMSPEQARRERADARSDVYCIGATLFHALTLRLPTWHDDSEAFWRAKREGAIDPPGEHERAACPAPLLAIALKALAADPALRYADASAMLDDLRRYQAGLAISALRESPWQRFRRWHARNGRTFWSWTVAAVAMLAMASLLWGKHVEEIARWGRPIVEEGFEDDGWRTRWVLEKGDFAARDGRLVTTVEDSANTLVLREPLRGAVAIEYDAEMAAGGQPGDISALWAREIRVREDGRCELVDAYAFQVGAFDGAHCAIGLRDGDTRMHLAYSAFRPEPGRRYRIRVEVDGNRLSLHVDGRLLCAWSDAIVFSGGHLGLYGQYTGKAFDRVRIYQREVPAKVSAIAIGDAAARAGVHDLAAAEYRQVARSHAGSALGDEATYKQGWCLWRLGREAEAERAWASLEGTPFAQRVVLHRAERLASRGEHVAALASIEGVRATADTDVRAEAAMTFAKLLAPHIAADDRVQLKLHLDAYERSFADAGAIGGVVASAYFQCRRFEEVVARFPGLRFLCASSLNQLGRHVETIERYRDQIFPYNEALFHVGRFDELSERHSAVQVILGLLHQGRYDECIERSRERFHAIAATAMVYAGRFDEARPLMPENAGWDRGRLLSFTGRAEEAAASTDQGTRTLGLIALGRWHEPGDPSSLVAQPWSRYAAAIEAWIAGDRAAVRAAVAKPHRPVWPDRRWVLHEIAVMPLLLGLESGDFAAFDRSLADASERWRWIVYQSVWHDAQYLLGSLDEARFLAQPYRGFAPARMLLLRAMRHERHGRRAEALADWRAWLEVPAHRRGEEIDGAMEALARWRIRELGG